MTLVEVLVALSLLAIVMAGLVPTFYGALAGTSAANHRTTANGLAVAATEAIRAAPYANVGFYQSQYGSGAPTAPCSSSSASPWVNLGATAPSSSAVLSPVATQTVNAVTYTLTSCLNWVSAAQPSTTTTTYAQAYKASAVYVTWKDTAGSHTLLETSAVYPGGLGPYTGPEGTSASTTTTTTPASGTPMAPTNVAATDVDSDTIDLTWQAPVGSNPAVASYTVEYNTTDTFGVVGTYATATNVTGTTWNVSGLTAGSTYYFEVFSVSAAGAYSISAGENTQGNYAPVSATTATPTTTTTVGSTSTTTTTPPCQVTGLTVSPTQIIVDKYGHMINNNGLVGLAVNARTSCSAITVQYTANGATTQSPILTGSGGQVTGSVGTSTTQWAVTNSGDPFTVYVNASQYAPVVQVLVNVCQEKGSSGKC